MPVSTPALRDRLEDIPSLAHHFIEKVCASEGITPRKLSPEAIRRLQGHSWPGNVRQLENVVEMAIAMCGDRETLFPSDFGLPVNLPIPIRSADSSIKVPETGMDFDRTVGQIERQILVDALKLSNGNKTAAAGMLGLKRTTLAAKLRSLEAVSAG